MNTNHLRLTATVIIAAAAAAGAHAADVEVYGQIDTGLYYEDGRGESPTLKMNSGTDISTLWGIRGKEDFGTDGYVRFVLESGFDSSTGAIANDTRDGAFFSRETLIIAGKKSVGEVAFGRTAGFLGSTGTYAQWAATGMNPMASNAADAALLGTFQGSPIMDNVITVKSREIAGFTLLGQYSNNTTQGTYDEADGFSKVQHVYALAAGYKGDGFTASAIWQMIDQPNKAGLVGMPSDTKPTHNFFLGATKTFGDLRVHVAYQHLEDARSVLGGPNALTASNFGFNGSASRDGFSADSFSVGANYPLWGGRIHGSFKMVHAEWNGDVGAAADDSGARYVGAIRYAYKLSKRTGLYALATYGYGDGMFKNNNTVESVATRVTAAVGLNHRY